MTAMTANQPGFRRLSILMAAFNEDLTLRRCVERVERRHAQQPDRLDVVDDQHATHGQEAPEQQLGVPVVGTELTEGDADP